jgi:hypothetical protein
MNELADEIRAYVDGAAGAVTLDEVRARHLRHRVSASPSGPDVVQGTPVPPGRRRPTAVRVITATVVAVVVVAGIGFAIARGPRSKGSTVTTTPTSALAAPHPLVTTAAQAIAIAEDSPDVTGVTRSAATLTTLRQVFDAVAPEVPPHAVPLSTPVWVVALSGTVKLPTALVPDTDTWEADFIDQLTGKGVGLVAGANGDWPPWFDGLADLSPSGGPTRRTLPTSRSAAQSFFDTLGAGRWTNRSSSSSSGYAVTAVVGSCTVSINGPNHTAEVSLVWLVCPPPPGPVGVSVPAADVALLQKTVARFDRSASSWVDKVRTTAASSDTSSGDVTLTVDSSPPPGSDRPVVDLTIEENEASANGH